MNTVTLIGRLVRPSQIHYGNERARATFTLAVDRMGAGADFIPVVCFGPTAGAVAEHTDKGHLVAIEARLSSGKYVGNDGETVYTLDVIAQRVTFLARPNRPVTSPATADTDTAEANGTDGEAH